MKIKILLLLLPLILIFSCKKYPVIIPPEVTVETSYFQTTPGSYWVYELYKVEQNGVETATGIIDTVRNVGTRVINNKTYVEKNGNLNSSRYRRDSLGYIIDQFGNVFYSYNNFTDTLETGSIDFLGYNSYKQMNSAGTSVTVPAGTFNAIESRQYLYKKSGDPISSCGELFVKNSLFIAPNIGLIKMDFNTVTLLQNCGYYQEKRLIDYYIP